METVEIDRVFCTNCCEYVEVNFDMGHWCNDCGESIETNNLIDYLMMTVRELNQEIEKLKNKCH
jgi:transcription initiation factor IIE alpha subunit